MTHRTRVSFEQRGSELFAVEIGQSSRSPVIAELHRALSALGVDVCSYRARPRGGSLVERIVLQRSSGGSLDGELSARAKAAILPIALPPRPSELSARSA